MDAYTCRCRCTCILFSLEHAVRVRYTYMYIYSHVITVVIMPPSPLYSYTPLMEAAREGHEDVVQLLVEHGANVNAQTEETQETALTLAACGGFIEVAQYLIEHGECSTWICLPVYS